MADNYKGSSKLVNSAYLYRSLLQLDAKRDKVLHDELFTDHKAVIEHYTLASQQDGSEGLLIVDTVVSNPDTEILLTDVQAKLLPDDLTAYAAGQYVVLVPEVPAYSEEVYLKKSAIDLDTVSKLSTIEETLDDGSKKQYLGFNNEKIETELQLDDVPTKDSDKFVNSGAVYGSLFETKQRTVIDTPENYVACQSTDTDALEVVDDSTTPTSTQVTLSTVQAFVPTALVGEYYQHIAEVSHDEPYEDTIYRKKEDSYSSTDVDEKIKEVNDRITEVASGGLKPLEMATYRTFFDNLVITADGYVEPQP